MSIIQIQTPQVTLETIRQRVLDQDRTFALYYPKLDGINDDKFYLKARAMLLSKQQSSGYLAIQTYADRRYTYMCCRDLILSKKYPERNKSAKVISPRVKPVRISLTPNGTTRTTRGSPQSPFWKDNIDRSLAEFPRMLTPGMEKSEANSAQSSSEQLFVSKQYKRRSDLGRMPETRKGDVPMQTSLEHFTSFKSRRRIDDEKRMDDISTTEYYQFVGMHCYFELKGSVTRIRFGRGSRNLLAFACTDRTISVIDLFGQSTPQTLKGHTKEILDFDWSATNDSILSASKDKTLRLWDVKSLKCIRFITRHETPLCCCFHPVNNNLLVASTSHGNIEFFNSSTGKEEPKSSLHLESPAKTIVFSPDGTWLYAGCNDGRVRWFRCTNSTHFNTFRFQGSAVVVKGKAIHSLAYREYHSVSKTSIPSLLLNVDDSTVRLLMITPELEDDRALTSWTMCPVVNKKHTIRSCFSPLLSNRTHACFATGSEDGNPYMFLYPIVPPPSGLAEVKRVPELTAHGNPVLDVAWNVDESLFASCDLGGLVIVWKRVKELNKEEGKKEPKEEKVQEASQVPNK